MVQLIGIVLPLALVGCATQPAPDLGNPDVWDELTSHQDDWLPPPIPGLDLELGSVVAGTDATMTATGAAPGETIYFGYGDQGLGAGPCIPQAGGLCLGVANPVILAGTADADASGEATLTYPVPMGAGAPAFQAVAVRGLGGVYSVASDAVLGGMVNSACNATVQGLFPDGDSFNYGCVDHSLVAGFEFDPDEAPYMKWFDLTIHGVQVGGSFTCSLTLSVDDICGPGVYTMWDSKVDADTVTLDCAGVDNPNEHSSFSLRGGDIILTTVDGGSQTGDLANTPLPTRVAGSFDLWGSYDLHMMGSFDVQDDVSASDVEQGVCFATSYELGHSYFCNYRLCAAGEGNCSYDSECEPGLTCTVDAGASYGFDSFVDVCE